MNSHSPSLDATNHNDGFVDSSFDEMSRALFGGSSTPVTVVEKGAATTDFSVRNDGFGPNHHEAAAAMGDNSN